MAGTWRYVRTPRVVVREPRMDIGGQTHVVAGRISLASQNVHDASFVHADSFAGTMPDSDVWRVRLRPSGYGATDFAAGLPKRSSLGLTGERSLVRKGDSNPHGIATASPSSWCVCQFRHFREEGRSCCRASVTASVPVSPELASLVRPAPVQPDGRGAWRWRGAGWWSPRGPAHRPATVRRAPSRGLAGP